MDAKLAGPAKVDADVFFCLIHHFADAVERWRGAVVHQLALVDIARPCPSVERRHPLEAAPGGTPGSGLEDRERAYRRTGKPRFRGLEPPRAGKSIPPPFSGARPFRGALSLLSIAVLMTLHRRILDRQVGRNAQQLAAAVADFGTPAERFPYLRILVSLIENAHPEWNQIAGKDRQIAELIVQMSGRTLDVSEVAAVVRVRDEERGIVYNEAG